MSAPILLKACRFTSFPIRHYSKAFRRKIVKVSKAEDYSHSKTVSSRLINAQEEELFDQSYPTAHEHDGSHERGSRTKSRSRASQHGQGRQSQHGQRGQPHTFVGDGDAASIGTIPYEKLEYGDRKFGSVIMCTKSRKHREEKKEILLEGRRLIVDALTAGVKIKSLFFSGADALNGLPSSLINAPVYRVPYRDMKMWSPTQTPAGLLGVFERPNQGEASVQVDSPLPLTLICDQISDPGNMGTLIRTAAAVGCDRVLVTKGSVDVWEPKVLRSGAGSHFRVPIISSLPWEQINNYLPENTKVFLADSRKLKEDHKQSKMTNMKTIEQLLEEQDNFDSDSDSNADEKLKLYKDAPLSVCSYDSVDFTGDHVVLVVGGETKGISLKAKKLAFDRFGECVTIPMLAGIDSLNSSVAGSILLYEINKQMKK